MIAYGNFLMSASFGMVAISMTGLGLQAGLERQAKVEEENKVLKQQLAAERLTSDLRLSEVERSMETMLSEANAAARIAAKQAGELVLHNKKLSHRLSTETQHRKLLATRLERAKDRNEKMLIRAQAAEALAEATEAHALELDAALSESMRLNRIYKEDNQTLREFASRHLPEVAPLSAQSDLEALKAALIDAKADETSRRDYHIGLACSGLRTFEASASGYSCRLGVALLAEARRLRQDPVCVSFESAGGRAHADSLAAR